MAETNQSLQTLDALSSVRGGLASEDGMARLKALELCQRLQLELETPRETLFRTFWAQVWTLAFPCLSDGTMMTYGIAR